MHSINRRKERILYLYTQRSSTGRRLLQTGCFTEWSPEIKLTKRDVILTWGRHSVVYPCELCGAKILNRVLCCDKRIQGQKILRTGLPLPKIYTMQREWEEDGKPNLVQKPYVGQGGRGIVKCFDQSGHRPMWLVQNVYQKFINKSREFRILQVGAVSAFYMEKFPSEDCKDICWNLDKGATWSAINDNTGQLRKQLSKLAEKALMALAYDFGAVDIIMDEEENLWILECNSRPGLGELNIVRFAKVMQRIYGGE